jgi:ADP-ribosylglycohydrolase
MAYYNALRQLEPPHTARFQNPYREWIGAQIRADLWGWICPGNPGLAAELAYRDAAVSHVKNGIYGEIFIAAAIAASFVVDTAAEAIRIGLEYIPQSSRLAEAIREVFRMYEEIRDFESAVDRLYELYGRYHWVHTINNAALVTAALLYSKGDYERGITYAVAGGWDTDCNGATVGSILGVIHGADRLPEKWIAPLRNTIRTSLRGFDRTTFPELAARTVTLAQRFSLDRR